MAIKKYFRCGDVSACLILFTLLTACGGGGGGGDGAVAPSGSAGITVAQPNGPGDVDNLFPLNTGDTWNVAIVEDVNTNGDQRTNTYTNIFRVTGSKMISGVAAKVVQQDNANGMNLSIESYYFKTGGGVNYYGDNDADDTITPLVIPHAELIFPLIPGPRFNRFVDVQKTFPDDLDGDGFNESLTFNSSVQTVAIESMQVSAGNFDATRRVEEDVTLTLQLSKDKSKWNSSSSRTLWYAPSVGQIKESMTQTTESPDGVTVDTSHAELQGYDVGGVKKGIQPPFTIPLPGISGGDEPSVGYDGSRYLITFFGAQGGQIQLLGMFLSPEGVQSNVFPIATFSAGFQITADAWPSIAFDGVNYLIVYKRTDFGRIYGIRVAKDGVVIDQNGGFRISNIVNPEDDRAPDVAFDGSKYLVVWHKHFRSNVYEGTSILGSFVTTNGIAGSEFIIASFPDSSRSNPSIAFNGSNYLVAWRDKRNTATSSAEDHVYAARVTPQGQSLDPGGMPIATTRSSKYSVQTRVDGADFRISWWDRDMDNFQNRYFRKRVTNDGALTDQPIAGNGLTVVTRNVARHGVVLIGDTAKLDVWSETSDAGTKSVASGAINSLVVWKQANALYGVFVYPKAE